MTPPARRFFALMLGLLVLVAAALLFPRLLAFAELAARELRYLWWLVLILALGVWLVFFLGRRRN